MVDIHQERGELIPSDDALVLKRGRSWKYDGDTKTEKRLKLKSVSFCGDP